MTAKLIAIKRKKDPKQLEEYFVAGLLHDIGKIPLNNKLSAEYVDGPLPHGQGARSPVPPGGAHHGGQPLRGRAGSSSRTGTSAPSWRTSCSSTTSSTSTPATNRDVLLTVAAANFFANTVPDRVLRATATPRSFPRAVFEELGITLDDLEAMEDKVNSGDREGQDLPERLPVGARQCPSA